MRYALVDLELEHLFIIYPGYPSYRMDDRISAVSIQDLSQVNFS
jgi:hypothetical protein